MADFMIDYVKQNLDLLGRKLEQFIGFSTVVRKIEEATGIPESYITTGKFSLSIKFKIL